jgi:hypothetical protein
VLEIRSVDLAAEHRDLVAQHEGLDLCGAVTTQHQNQELEDASQRAVGKRPEHRSAIMPAPAHSPDTTRRSATVTDYLNPTSSI